MRRVERSAALLVAICAAVCSYATHAGAQAKYPTRPVTMIVPQEPGGSSDVIARLIAEKLTAMTGQQFLVVNKPGASGIIGNQFVQNSTADGYTLLYATSGPFTLLPAINSQVPYDPVKDFETAAIVAKASPLYILTTPQTGLKDLKSLVDRARDNPDKLKFSSTGPGTTNSVVARAFGHLAKVRMVEVPYKGAAPIVTALLANEVDYTYAVTVSFKEHSDAGKIVPIAVISDQRTKTLPNVPTVGEAGYPELTNLTSWRIWHGVFLPRGTPKDIVEFLNKAIDQVLSDPPLQKRFEDLDLEVQKGLTASASHQFMAKEVADWKSIAEQLNLKAQ